MPDVTDWFSKNSEFRVRIKMMKQPAFPAEPQPDVGCFFAKYVTDSWKNHRIYEKYPLFLMRKSFFFELYLKICNFLCFFLIIPLLFSRKYDIIKWKESACIERMDRLYAYSA
ncbi:MAG TPA: hypothetical protein DGP36_05830 [Ruminococcus sp.]|nr:hypothetical protein [Ruminococcus sp.]